MEEEEGESNDIDDDPVMGLADMGASGSVVVSPHNLRENVGPPDKFSSSPFQRLTKAEKQLAKEESSSPKKEHNSSKDSLGSGRKSIEIGYDSTAHKDDISSDHACPSNPSHSGNRWISVSLFPLVLVLDQVSFSVHRK
ncbi:hypothetical protein PIB30_098122 [Stylosanthes scabra]|uniref:Uncharacterized protein n=1 Tax=Stylosanthes scabra TaxID=79078 RepID=A0ABU6YX46_9FABA|nr:hypothetical protein [Stylosanthes scabra]